MVKRRVPLVVDAPPAKARLTSAALKRHESDCGMSQATANGGESVHGGGKCSKTVKGADGDEGYIGCACQICSVICEPDASNWPERKQHGKRVVPVGLTCARCAEFSKASNINIKALLQMQKVKLQASALKTDLDEFAEHKETDPDNRPWGLEEVFEQTVIHSVLRESYEFRTRQQFNNEEGIWPEDCKLQQCAALTHNDTFVTGIVVRSSEPRYALDVFTDRQLVHKRPLMTTSDHCYTRQGEHVFHASAQKGATTLHQQHGNKYKPSLKNLMVYDRDEVTSAVNAYNFKAESHSEPVAPGLSSLLGKSVSVDAMCGGSEEERASQDGVDETVSAPGEADDTAHVAEPAFRTSFSSPQSKGSKGMPLKRSPSFSMGGSASTVKQERTQPPSYWLGTLDVSCVFLDRNLNRQLQFAKACVQRNARGQFAVGVADS